MLVSFARGVGITDPIPDPLAGELLPEPLGGALRALRGSARLRPLGRELFRRATLGLVDHISLRTLAIDAVAASAMREGAAQCVLLGAGLDARAYRMDALRGARVFEVDHPSTQRFKREKARALPAPVAELTYVPVEFGQESLAARLTSEGFDSRSPALFVWEGVTMYLTPEAVAETLDSLGRLAAADSTLVISYSIPNPLGSRRGELAKRLLFGGVFGEPMIGVFTPDEMRALLEERGFRVLRDDQGDGWAAGAGIEKHRARLFGGERLVVARRI